MIWTKRPSYMRVCEFMLIVIKLVEVMGRTPVMLLLIKPTWMFTNVEPAKAM